MPAVPDTTRPWQEMSGRARSLVVLGYALAAVASLVGAAAVAWPGWQLASISPVAGAVYGTTILGLGGLVWAASRARRARRQAAWSWAQNHGWEYVDRSSAVLGTGGHLLRTMLDGVAISSYETIAAPDPVSGSPRAAMHAVEARVAADLPTLVLLPETSRVGVGVASSGRDIQLESVEFNARWRVLCDDARFAHAFCHPRMMERLMRPDAVGLSVLVDGRDVIVHAPGNQVLDAVEARAALAVDLVRLIPPYVLEQHPPRTRRRRRRRSEHSSVAVVLAVLLWGGWLGLLVVLGMAGAVEVAVAFALPSVVVPAAVLAWLARRRAATRGSLRGTGVPIPRS